MKNDGKACKANLFEQLNKKVEAQNNRIFFPFSAKFALYINILVTSVYLQPLLQISYVTDIRYGS